ncbi:MAG: tetratricopeptide repeat protein [Bacteroidia bacterium]
MIRISTLAFRLFTFILLASSNYTYATQSDSLSLIESYKNSKNDSDKVLALGALARYYAPFDNEKALTNYKLAIDICEKNLINEKLEFFEKEKGALLASIGVTHYMVADYAKAIKAELEAVSIFNKYNVKEKLGRCYVVIGAIYSHQDQTKQALEYQKKSFELSKQLSDSAGIALALNNMGISYFDIDSNVLAIRCYRKALRIYSANKNKRGLGVELLNIGSVHKKLKNLDSAIFYFEKTVDIRTEINDEQGLIFSYARLGQAYLDKKFLDPALSCGIKSLHLAEKKQYPRGIRDANELLAFVYEKKGDYKEAFKHIGAFHAAKDSMSDAESISKVAKSESKFKFKQEALKDSLQSLAEQNQLKTELELQKAQTDTQNQRVRFLALVVALFIIVVILVIIQNRKSKRQNQIIDKQKKQVEKSLIELTKRDDEKDLLLKEIHHRVKNNLQVISSLLELQSKKVSNSESEVFKEGQSRVRAMALIHEELYQNDNLAEVDFKSYTAKLSRQIQSLFPNTEKVKINISGPILKLDIDTAIPLGLILNELITNAFKYALTQNGALNIQFYQTEKGNYTVKVIDTGNGLPEDFNIKKSKSLGLRLVNRLAKQLYGKAKYSNQNHSTFEISFKDTIERKKVA